MPTEKIDLVRSHPTFFKAPRAPKVVDLGAAKFLIVEGRGAPEGRAFQAGVGTLYQTAYALKFASKAKGRDFRVAPLEAQWWADAKALRKADPEALWKIPREKWRWRLLMMVPEFITARDVAGVSGPSKDGSIPKVELTRVKEGRCVQALHVGPYATEPETIQRMRALMASEHLAPNGFHHEIYLGDPRRSAPDKLKTILRQPVARA